MNSYETGVAKKVGVAELCREWGECERAIRDSFKAIHDSVEKLNLLFGTEYRSLTIQRHNEHVNFADPSDALEELKRRVWQSIAGQLELRPMLSMAKLKELDEQLSTGKGLPPIEYGAVMSTLANILSQRQSLLEEKVRECYQWLRPERGWRREYVTNAKSIALGVGSKVVLTWAVERGYSRTGGFSVRHNTYDQLRALDQVFHMLDGKPYDGPHNGDLCEAIRTQTGNGCNTFESKYFKGRCFKNMNLHLEFTRADLLDKFNLICGGNRLPEAAACAER